MGADVRALLRRIPKAELHLHLEGAAPASAMAALRAKYGAIAPEEPPGTRSYRDLPGFIEAWRRRTALMREYEDFRLVAAAVGRALAAAGVVYAEVHFSAGSFIHRHGLLLQEMLLHVNAGLSMTPSLEARLIVDLVRDHGPARGARLLDETLEVAAEAGVVAIGLGGTEGAFSIEGYSPLFARARDRGLRVTAHAGEAAGPWSVWSALRDLGAERIGHGTRSVDDPTLVAHLAEQGVPLEVCISSNVCLGVVADAAAHPITALSRAGVAVTLSSDDPAMFDADLLDECCLLHDQLGFTVAEIAALLRAGFEHSFLPDPKKRAALCAFDTQMRAVRRAHLDGPGERP